MQLKKFEPLVLLVAMVLPTIVTWIYFVSLKDSPAEVQKTAYGVGKTIQFLLPVVWIAVCCRESLSTLLPWKKTQFEKGSSLGAGSLQEDSPRPAATLLTMKLALGFGAFVAVSVFVGFYCIAVPLGVSEGLVAEVNEKVAGMGLDSRFQFILLGVFYAIVHSFMEEYYWRWFVFRRMLGHTQFGIALVLSSLGFMAHHVILMATFLGWGSLLGYFVSATVAVGGMVWAWLYRRSGSLLSPWVSHMIVDAAIFALGYVLVFGV